MWLSVVCGSFIVLLVVMFICSCVDVEEQEDVLLLSELSSVMLSLGKVPSGVDMCRVVVGWYVEHSSSSRLHVTDLFKPGNCYLFVHVVFRNWDKALMFLSSLIAIVALSTPTILPAYSARWLIKSMAVM